MTDPDSQLIAQARAGDKAAFGELVNHYYEMVYAVALGVVNQRETARDVAQNVFIKVFREINRFEGKSKFKTWLYRIAVNAAIDESRRVRRTDSLDMTDASDDDDKKPLVITDPKPGPLESASVSERGEKVREALEQLSPDHRAVLVLREWQDASYDEIAEALGIEIGTVMSRLFYARKKLGEILAGKI